MNTKIVLASAVAALSGLAGLANTASAGTDIRVNVDFGRPGPVIVAPRYAPPAPAYCPPPPPAPRGYWKDVSVKVWVPAEWVVSRDRRGCEVRSLRPGYFTYRTDRVWVADVGPRGGYGHGYGYGRG